MCTLLAMAFRRCTTPGRRGARNNTRIAQEEANGRRKRGAGIGLARCAWVRRSSATSAGVRSATPWQGFLLLDGPGREALLGPSRTCPRNKGTPLAEGCARARLLLHRHRARGLAVALGAPKEHDVRLGLVDGVVIPPSRLLHPDGPPLRLGQQLALGEALGNLGREHYVAVLVDVVIVPLAAQKDKITGRGLLSGQQG